MEPDHREQRCHRPHAFDKMEELVKEMQDSEAGGVPVRSQKLFLTSIPAAFMGYDLIEWLIMRLEIEESEALNIANQLCQYGYFFPISDSKNLVVKDDSSLYRFQSPFYWPWRNKPPDNVDYAIYLMKRSLRNKQRHGLEDYEQEAFTNLKRNLSNKWDIITTQAEEQLKYQKSMKKPDKSISDSQEKAYWRVHRPPPGVPGSLEQVPVPTRCWNGLKPRKKTIDDCRREVELLRASLYRTRVKVSQALEGLVQHVDTYTEFDPLMVPPQPSNPWVNEDTTYWQLNAPIVEVPTEKRIRKWGLSMEDLLSDPTGVQEFTNYLQKEKSEENILFWLAVNDLRRSSQSQVLWKIKEIYENYVKHGSPREVNIDNQTMDKVLEGMKNNSRFCFDAAQEHVYNLLLKKDCYPRFVRSEYYKTLLSNGVQPLQKKRFFGFGPTKKKTSTSSQSSQSQQSSSAQASTSTTAAPCGGGALSKRRGSDRSLSGSAHEISHFGVNSGTQTTVVKETKVPHSHSQSNLSDIPYRVKKPSVAPGASTSEEVCPWETPATPPSRSQQRKNSIHVDSESSSSDVSVGVAAAAVVETSEKQVTQQRLLLTQHTLDCGKTLNVGAYETPRRASVSVPITHHPHPSVGNQEGARRKVSSFEDTSSSSTAAGADSDHNDARRRIGGEEAKKEESKKNEEEEEEEQGESLARGLEASCSMSGGSPIIISVSSASDDAAGVGHEQDGARAEPKAPLAEPDSESPASELPPSELADVEDVGAAAAAPTAKEGDEGGAAAAAAVAVTTGKEDEEAARNTDVCPWEDEESCKVNTPFVKKYATLGYL